MAHKIGDEFKDRKTTWKVIGINPNGTLQVRKQKKTGELTGKTRFWASN